MAWQGLARLIPAGQGLARLGWAWQGRQPVDLNDFLTDEERRHYERFIGAGSLTVFVHPDPRMSWQWTATTVSTGQPQAFRYAAIAAVQ